VEAVRGANRLVEDLWRSSVEIGKEINGVIEGRNRYWQRLYAGGTEGLGRSINGDLYDNPPGRPAVVELVP
jgi:hypothetical protein